MQQTLSNDPSSKIQICRWVARFKCGNLILQDEECPGPTKHVTIPEIVEKVHNTVLVDRRVKTEQIARIVNMSNCTYLISLQYR